MSVPILQMRGIEKRFPGVRALQGVDLDVGAGEVVALVGENGAGKSTLMKILGGVYQPDGGQIHIDGEPVVINSVADAIKLGISFIHQELNVLDNLDIAGNVFLGREPVSGGFLHLINRQQMRVETDVLLGRLGLNVPSTTLVSRISLAQQQMVEIAKALSLRARLLIMDEPTSSLTLSETARLLDVVKDLRSQGVGVIYISHRLREVEEIADRVVVLRDGALVGTLERSEINHDQMVRLMVGRQIKQGEHGPSNKESDYFSVENLRTFRYPQKSVSLRVGKGEILGLAGLVGAGRSETAQAIFGVDGAMHGATVQLDGETLHINSPGDAVRHGIFLIPEDRRGLGLVIDFPIRQNATLASLEKSATAGLISFNRERTAAQTICGELNVKAPSVEERVGNLSGGNQQKVVLAKWLSLAPKVLIFDEPTRGIDVGAKAEIYALMRRLADSGVAIIMISSEMEEILEMSDRVAVMHEGGITGVLDRAHCTEEAIMYLAVGRGAGKTGGEE